MAQNALGADSESGIIIFGVELNEIAFGLQQRFILSDTAAETDFHGELMLNARTEKVFVGDVEILFVEILVLLPEKVVGRAFTSGDVAVKVDTCEKLGEHILGVERIGSRIAQDVDGFEVPVADRRDLFTEAHAECVRVAVIDIKPFNIRITSYNVCYTKLLRNTGR